MAFTRRYLKELGLEAEAIDKIMEEHGKSMDGMVTKSEAEEWQKKAIEDARKVWDAEPKKYNVKDTDEYKELDKKYADLMLDTQLSQNKVLAKYKDFVRSKLPSDKTFEEGIKAIQGEYPEFFEQEKKEEEQKNEPAPKPKVVTPDKKDDSSVSEEESIKKAFMSAFMR